MSSILTIIFNAQVLLLEGKNLIITGNNGAGKTRFLNDLANNLKGNIHYNNKDLRNKIISEINFGIINFHPSLEFTEHENGHLKFILKNDLYHLEDTFSKELINFKRQLNHKFNIFNKNKITFLEKSSKNIKHPSNNKLIVNIDSKNKNQNQKEFYYYASEHIENYIKNLTKMIDLYIANKKTVEVILYNLNKDSIYFFDSSRVERKDFSLDQFKTYDEFLDSGSFTNIEGALEAYLLLQKLELLSLLKHRKNKSPKIKKINEIEKWFIKVESDLKWILENTTTELIFTANGNRVLIKQDSRLFSLDDLSSGFKAIFNIYANLLMRAQMQNLAPEDLAGIALIDEIDVHLHISLQKKVLPFLIKAFPKIQFIVSTHSPFVITSQNTKTVVFDLTTNELIRDDLSRYSYESVIKGLFHVEIQSEQLKSEIEEIAKIINNEPNNYEKLRNILRNITPFAKQLDFESKSFYFKALNHLLDNQELGDLDV
ncbi:ATP-binding protein [Acinetobacter sp. WCHA55]|uniref:AAA family ATPase n=1 Tax=Acinetobacter sp. WCHA55 TaxID=2004646 RepID=UPI000B3C7241|nr:AAA family ATPase [Acinetobacter sp. WCHA55]AYA68032.1 ATP-binding protein [Acinetobacter sp. WCHA55]